MLTQFYIFLFIFVLQAAAKKEFFAESARVWRAEEQRCVSFEIFDRPRVRAYIEAGSRIDTHAYVSQGGEEKQRGAVSGSDTCSTAVHSLARKRVIARVETKYTRPAALTSGRTRGESSLTPKLVGVDQQVSGHLLMFPAIFFSLFKERERERDCDGNACNWSWQCDDGTNKTCGLENLRW